MPRLSRDQWLEIRQQWESDPTATYTSLAAAYGVSIVSAYQMSMRQGWVKADALPNINRAAHIRADVEDAKNDPKRILNDPKTSQNKSLPLVSSVEQSTDLRAKLIQAHRAEWRRHAALYPLEEIKKTFEVGKSGKISAEQIAIRQQGERKAWGMDEQTQTATAVGVLSMPTADLARMARQLARVADKSDE